MPQVARQLEANRVNLKRLQLLSTGLWDDPRIFDPRRSPGGLYAAPDISAGFRKRCSALPRALAGLTRANRRRWLTMRSR